MNRIPTQPITFEDFQQKCDQLHDDLATTLERWVEQEVSRGASEDIARAQVASALLSASLNQYYRVAKIPAQYGGPFAVQVSMVIAAGITQIQAEMRR